jgi:hypothetical protein
MRNCGIAVSRRKNTCRRSQEEPGEEQEEAAGGGEMPVGAPQKALLAGATLLLGILLLSRSKGDLLEDWALRSMDMSTTETAGLQAWDRDVEASGRNAEDPCAGLKVFVHTLPPYSKRNATFPLERVRKDAAMWGKAISHHGLGAVWAPQMPYDGAAAEPTQFDTYHNNLELILDHRIRTQCTGTQLHRVSVASVVGLGGGQQSVATPQAASACACPSQRPAKHQSCLRSGFRGASKPLRVELRGRWVCTSGGQVGGRTGAVRAAAHSHAVHGLTLRNHGRACPSCRCLETHTPSRPHVCWGLRAQKALNDGYYARVRRALQEHPAWRRCGGCDHLLVIGRDGNEFTQHSWAKVSCVS